MTDNKKFDYTYSVPTEKEKEEIKNIQMKYTPLEKDNLKLSKLKTLDKKVKTTPLIISLTLGIFGILIFGLGLTMVLEWCLYFFGIIVSIVGIIPTFLAYPVYNKVLSKMKKKYSHEILKLSEELLNQTDEVPN